MGIWDNLMQSTQQVTSKAAGMTEIAKLNLEIGEEERQLEKLYQSLGAKYYESARGAAEAAFPELCGEIDQRRAGITQRRERVQALKGFEPCASCGEMLAPGDEFCKVCGQRRARPQPAPGDERTYCPHCGQLVLKGAFCSVCGKGLERAEASQESEG